ncbi:hypothetical protein [Acanthopleuribacter pedis]|uniref:Uncharacterized protein n=1 Tax=Acanthopleuribacter pedis TaxID=442870 RepID=A0A8J7QFX0_9BACT|nr:hypothetical protein [Acanthopleuribacter pedis]MBO1319250.1 hypothetical protein [Acanthopleuribacter pedis]
MERYMVLLILMVLVQSPPEPSLVETIRAELVENANLQEQRIEALRQTSKREFVSIPVDHQSDLVRYMILFGQIENGSPVVRKALFEAGLQQSDFLVLQESMRDFNERNQEKLGAYFTSDSLVKEILLEVKKTGTVTDAQAIEVMNFSQALSRMVSATIIAESLAELTPVGRKITAKVARDFSVDVSGATQKNDDLAAWKRGILAHSQAEWVEVTQ